MKATGTERELSDSDDSNMLSWCLVCGRPEMLGMALRRLESICGGRGAYLEDWRIVECWPGSGSIVHRSARLRAVANQTSQVSKAPVSTAAA